MIPKVLFLALFLLLTIVSAVDLGVKLDQDLAPKKDKTGRRRGQGWYLWSSYVDVNEEPTDGQLAAMARDAYNEAMADMKKEKIEGKEPTVMAALAVDKQVFLSSSMRGAKYVYKNFENECGDDDTDAKMEFTANIAGVKEGKEIQDALKSCMEASKEAGGKVQHEMSAMCGEVMSTYAWLLKHSGQSIKDKKARVVPWNKHGYVMKPCASNKKANPTGNGCYDFVGEMKIEAAPKKNLEDYAKIVVKTDQQKLPVKELPPSGKKGGAKQGGKARAVSFEA